MCGRVGCPDGLNVPMVEVEQSQILWFIAAVATLPAPLAVQHCTMWCRVMGEQSLVNRYFVYSLLQLTHHFGLTHVSLPTTLSTPLATSSNRYTLQKKHCVTPEP